MSDFKAELSNRTFDDPKTWSVNIVEEFGFPFGNQITDYLMLELVSDWLQLPVADLSFLFGKPKFRQQPRDLLRGQVKAYLTSPCILKVLETSGNL
jgi:hypothetical protein